MKAMGRERADRRDAHDHSDDAEEDFAGCVDRPADAQAELAHAGDREAEQDRDQQDLQQVARAPAR